MLYIAYKRNENHKRFIKREVSHYIDANKEESSVSIEADDIYADYEDLAANIKDK